MDSCITLLLQYTTAETQKPFFANGRIAKRRCVFKIETIGDCYLAVTGIPRPQERHALIMARFASECLEEMNLLIYSKLVDLLGEDTGKLQMRVGLNSGPGRLWLS
jgi:class 3 adenylate cyclase